jgi:predicted acetyltransferase
MPELVAPAVVFRESYLEAMVEFQAENSIIFQKLDYYAVAQNFDKYVEVLLSHAEGQNLQADFVSCTHLWLVEGRKFLGQVSIRHQLTPRLLHMGGHIGYNIRPSERLKGYGRLALKLALPEAKKLGINRALVTCDEDNIGSKKIIEANGGVFEDARPGDPGHPLKLRYWIDINSERNPHESVKINSSFPVSSASPHDGGP